MVLREGGKSCEPAEYPSRVQREGPRQSLAVSQSQRDAGGVLGMPGSCGVKRRRRTEDREKRRIVTDPNDTVTRCEWCVEFQSVD